MVSNVAYLGPAGTYTHQAATEEFGTDANLLPQKSIGDCFLAINSRSVDYAVVPLENSTNGQVVFTFDFLRDWFLPSGKEKNIVLPSPPLSEDSCKETSLYSTEPDFKIIGEQYVPIHHCLLTEAKSLDQITKIYSHPQVWGQVTKFISANFKDAQKIDTSSTSKAAELAKAEGPHVAAIAAATSSPIHSIPILEKNIEDVKTNSTRFLILGRENHTPVSNDSSDSHITFLAFTVSHENHGALCDVLDCLKRYGLNLTSITSRPSHLSSWQYVFFVEFYGSLDDPKTIQSIAEIKGKSSNCEVLGCFSRSKKYWIHTR